MKPRRKALTIVCGNAGVGKTTFARQLANEEGALLLDIDTASEALVRAGLSALGLDPNDRDSPRYKKLFRSAIHETLFALADDNLPRLACIVVAPFTQERRDPRFLQKLESRFRTRVQIFYLICDDETRRERILERGNPRDRSKLEHWEAYRRTGEDQIPPPFSHVLIDTSESENPPAAGDGRVPPKSSH